MAKPTAQPKLGLRLVALLYLGCAYNISYYQRLKEDPGYAEDFLQLFRFWDGSLFRDENSRRALQTAILEWYRCCGCSSIASDGLDKPINHFHPIRQIAHLAKITGVPANEIQAAVDAMILMACII